MIPLQIKEALELFIQMSSYFSSHPVRKALRLKRAILLAVLATLPPAVFAGDAAELNFIGFSSDGKYLAFEQSGTQDGSGFPYAQTFFIDTEDNKFIRRPRMLLEETESITVQDLRGKLAQMSENTLADLGIVPGNQGSHVISHPLTDLGADSHRVRFSISTPLSGMISQDYELILTETEIDSNCFYFGPAKLFTLKLINHKTGREKILQKDSRLPKSRNCPLGYRIQDVFVARGKYLAVFLNVFQPGFEGQNMRFLAVTGTLN